MTQYGWRTVCGCLQGLARLEELVRKLMDIVDNRVQANLDTIRVMQLVELPADRCACVQGCCLPCTWPGVCMHAHLSSRLLIGLANHLPGWVCRSFSYEEFIAAQDKFQKRQADRLAVLNEEVARAIEDVIELVQVGHVLTPPQGTAAACTHFERFI